MDRKQSPGRIKNAASPADRATPDQTDRDAQRTGEKSRKAAGPDGPDAREIGNTFKAK
jgi:hypothetical protein